MSTETSEMKTCLSEFSTILRQRNENQKTLRELELKLFETNELLNAKGASQDLSEKQILQLEKAGNFAV